MIEQLTPWLTIYNLLMGEVVFRVGLGVELYKKLSLSEEELFLLEWMHRQVEIARAEVQKEQWQTKTSR